MFCKHLYQAGITKEIISQKESEIINTLKSQNAVISGQIDDSNTAGQSQLPPVSTFSWV